ncbi:MAG TPA: MFS transporter [Methanocorpusculum sp.]|nr:MFS transporter [Methanocorpusculum sp.]
MDGQKYLNAPAVITLITALSIIGPLSTDMYLPALSEIVAFFGTTEAFLNITLYGFLFTQALGVLFIGPVSDKFGRKYLLLGSIAVYIISSVLCAAAPDIFWFIVLRCIQGISTGGLIVIATALIKDCFRDIKVRGRVLTLTVFFGVVGPIAAPILGAWIIHTINWQSTLIFPAFLMIVCIIGVLFLTEPLGKEERLTDSISASLLRLPKLCKNRVFTLFLIAMGLPSMALLCYVAISSYIFVDGFGISGTLYSFVLAGNALLATLAMLVLQRFVASVKMRRYGLVLLVFTILSGILLLLFGEAGPLACMFCIFPMCVGAFAARPYALGILLQQYAGDTGSVSSLFNFTVMIFCCIGMFCGTLPWPTHIFGLGCMAVISGGLGVIVWALLRAGGMKLKGMD